MKTITIQVTAEVSDNVTDLDDVKERLEGFIEMASESFDNNDQLFKAKHITIQDES